jgi:hypothetical protein
MSASTCEQVEAGWAEEDKQRTQSDMGVPSSANWNPMNPLASRIQKMAQIRPTCTDANHCDKTDDESKVRQGCHSSCQGGLVDPRRPTREKLGGWTDRVDDVRCWDDARVEEDGQEVDDRVHVEEHDDLLATCEVRRVG